MPELPEVETVVRGLRRHVAGRTITGVSVGWHKTVQGHEPAAFCAVLTGRRFVSAHRRGKYIVLELDDASYITIHLRMTGRLFILPAGAAPAPHTHIIWSLDDGRELHFVDPRKFGRVALLPAAGLAALDAKLGPEPLADLTPELLAARVRRRSIAVKSALLDQSVVAGIGNIYADEALFRAAIDPRRPASSLTTGEVSALCTAMREVLAAAVERHGTTLSDEQFVGLEGRMGENQGHLAVFRRTGQACPRCGATVQRIRLGGRSTHFCANCQT